MKVIMKQFTWKMDANGKPLYDGDRLGLDCNMIDDYTGKESIEVQELIVQFNHNKNCWGVYCPSAMLRDNWGFIPSGAYKI